MDTPVLLALISVGGVGITGLASVAVAVITNRREARNTADEAADRSADKATEAQLAAKDERIQLRDEQLILRDAQLADCLEKNAETQGELQRVTEKLERMRKRYEEDG